jgi:hypothetical protein
VAYILVHNGHIPGGLVKEVVQEGRARVRETAREMEKKSKAQVSH